MRVAIAFILVVIAPTAWGDEGYQFYRLSCDREAVEVRIEPVIFWNIRERVWGDSWLEHVSLLKKLERDHGLYVFNQEYGYFDHDEISIRCGSIEARITYELWEKTYDGQETRQVRIKPVAWLYTEDGKRREGRSLAKVEDDATEALALRMIGRPPSVESFKVKLAEGPNENPCCIELESGK